MNESICRAHPGCLVVVETRMRGLIIRLFGAHAPKKNAAGAALV
jgi:hypothetical protein